MNRFYAACELGPDFGRVVLGTLQQDRFVLSEARRFENVPLSTKEMEWDIPLLYGEVIEGLRSIASSQEPITSMSFCSWTDDYMLFEGDRTLISPVYQGVDSRTEAGLDRIQKRISDDTLYAETGIQGRPTSTLFQLAAESSRRLWRAKSFLPIADGFNYLFSGVAKAELSMASATQVFNPTEGGWSRTLMDILKLQPTLFPELTTSGTDLGPLREDLAGEVGLEDVRVVASCSHRLACSLMGLPIQSGSRWAFLSPLRSTRIGVVVPQPVLRDSARNLGFNNELGWGGEVILHKTGVGMRLLEECQRQWSQTDRGLDFDVLSHLAGSAPAFESLIDPTDLRFRMTGNIQEKIQAYCKETGQTVPRKPGPIFRCILESLALMVRRFVEELECFTGSRIDCLYVMGEAAELNMLLTHFIANSVQLPIIVVPRNTIALGNIVIQALAAGHVENLEHARALLQKSVPARTIFPHGTAWDHAYHRVLSLQAA